MAIAATLIDAYGLRLKPEQIWELQTFADVERVIGECVYRGRKRATADAPVAAEVLPKNPPLLPAAKAPRMLAQGSTVGDETHSPVSIVVAASFTVEPLASSLRLWTGTYGLRTPTASFGVNQIFRALLDVGSSFWANADGLNVVLLRCEDLPEDPATARKAVDDLLTAARRFAESTSHNAKLAVATLPPLLPGSMFADRVAANELRDYWQHALTQIAGIEIIDFAGIVEGIGLDAPSDRAMERVTRAPYSRAVYRDLGIELAHVLQRRRNPRVLALDCDGRPNRARVEMVIRQTLDQPSLVLRSELAPFDVPGWDLLSNAKIILALEKEFGTRIDVHEVVGLACIGDLFSLIDQKLEGDSS
jgi:acyl carrier protein